MHADHQLRRDVAIRLGGYRGAARRAKPGNDWNLGIAWGTPYPKNKFIR